MISVLNRILAMSRRKGDCLICYMGLDKDGYSQVDIGGKIYRTHRVIMNLMEDFDLKSPLLILHNDSLCSSKSCIEYNHLRIGTISENARDRDDKHEHGNRKGHVKTTCERHPNAERRTNSFGRSFCVTCRKEAHQRHKDKTTKLQQEKRG